MSALLLLLSALSFANAQYYQPYSENDAKHALYFAYASYCKQADLEIWDCKWCSQIPKFEIVNVTLNNYLQAFVGYDTQQNQVVVTFRGTKNFADWFKDLSYIQQKYPNVDGAYVHSGFYNAWENDLKPIMFAVIKMLMDKHKGKPILITGHSLGAALAQVAALDITMYAEMSYNRGNVNLYTFGSPRWANSVMADYFKDSVNFHYRLVNRYDPIPLHPYTFEGIKSPFQHTATEVWYTSDDPLEYKVCDGSGEDPDCKYGETILAANNHLTYLNIKEGCNGADSQYNATFV